MGLTRRKKIWWWSYTDPTTRKRHRLSTRLTSFEAAEAWVRRRRLALEREWSGLEVDPNGLHTLHYWPQYRADMVRRDLVRAYINETERELRNFAARVPGLGSITAPVLQAWIEDRALEINRKTVRNYYQMIRGYLAFCQRMGYLAHHPCDSVRVGRVVKPVARRTLSQLDLVQLYFSSPHSRGTAYLFCAYTGLRRGEARQARWNWLEGQSIRVPAKASKSRVERVVPIPTPLSGCLRLHRQWLATHWRAVEPDDLIFPSFKLHHISVGGIPRCVTLRADMVAAGLPELDDRGRAMVLHGLRHSLGTNLAVSGADIHQIRDIMRHSDIRTSAGYIDAARINSRAAVDNLVSFRESDRKTLETSRGRDTLS